ncbi:MAG: enoyl-CoA hydratase/isomerase family protein [Blastocatellia bacterium]
MADFTQILYEVRDAVAFLTLNRPEKRNALSAALVAEIKTALTVANTDDAVKVIVLRAAGKDFCAGADLAQLERAAQATVLDNRDDAAGFAEMLLLMRRVAKPVIAAVHGRAYAGGAGLASACDLIVAARAAQFCYPEVKIGFVPAMVLAIARRNLSDKRAFEILVTGKPFGAEEAERIGFINRVFADETFTDDVEKYAIDIAQISASAMALTKYLLYQTDAMSFEKAVYTGVDMNAIARMTADCRAGVQKFLQK